MKIITNNIPRPIIYGYELTDKEKLDFDFLSDEEIICTEFFRYKGDVEYLGDYMAFRHESCFSDIDKNKWHGYKSDSFFSALLIRLSDCGEAVTVGLYLS